MNGIFRVLICSVIFCPIAFAADWAQWRGSNRTGHVPFGEIIPKELPTAPRIIWHVPLVDGDHWIAEVGGKNGAAFVCFDKKTGDVVWKAQNDTPAYAAPIITNVAGKRMMIAFMVEGVVAIDPADGKLLWRFPVKTALGR